ncbi:hypothetical protein [Streptomyces mirabilis]|uniref:hypothetical protein n=1 Tax=Streptomyces mirabilis TaxID=68239 RepID=UPI00210CD071|nr:hypothetical protein [Streptomyces mirabilis]
MSWKNETANACGPWEMCGGRAALDVDPDSILAWGVTSGADIYCWLTRGDSPDLWPVLVCWRHTNPLFQVLPFGMAEFLRRLLTDEEFQEETICVLLSRALLRQLARGETALEGRPRSVHRGSLVIALWSGCGTGLEMQTGAAAVVDERL